MSYSPAEWEKHNELATAISPKLQDTVAVIQQSSESLREVIRIFDGVFETVEKFLQAYSDPISPFIKAFSESLKVVARDIGSIGASAIVITPFNRMSPRMIPYRPSVAFANPEVYKVDVLHQSTEASKSFEVTVPPIDLPAMTPAEAFVELRNSFYNEDDPYRPRWSENVKTGGFGILLIPAVGNEDIGEFLKSIEAIGNFFDFSDIKKALDGYRSQLEMYEKDLQESMYKNIADRVGGSGIYLTTTEVTYESPETGEPVKKIELGEFKVQTKLPTLHWYGLSIENLPIIKAMTDSLFTLLDWISEVTSTVSSALKELLNIIKNKIYTFIELIQNVMNSIAVMANILTVTNLYTFKIDFEWGGVDHIIESLQTSVTNPQSEAASDITKAWVTSQFSFLFFAGAGGEINTEVWDNLFGNLLPATETASTTEEEDEVDSEGVVTTKEYTITGVSSGAIYPKNTTFNISFASENTNLYFTYEIAKKDGSIVSKWTDHSTNKLSSNQSIPAFFLTEEDEYTLKVYEYWEKDQTDEPLYKFIKFQVSRLVSKPIISPINSLPFTFTAPEGVDVVVKIIDATTGKVIDQATVYGGTTVTLGGHIIGAGIYIIEITDGTDTTKILTPIDVRYPVIELDTFQSLIYSPSVPVQIHFSTKVADAMIITVNGKKNKIQNPGYQIFPDYNIPYKAAYFQDGTWRQGTITIVPTDTKFGGIC